MTEITETEKTTSKKVKNYSKAKKKRVRRKKTDVRAHKKVTPAQVKVSRKLSKERTGEKAVGREEERARKREERRRKVRRQKIIIAVSAAVIVVCAIAGAAVWSMPSAKLSRALGKGDKYSEKADYESAKEAYEEALQIEPGTVKAYRCIADNYLAQGMTMEAKETLHAGYLETRDSYLMDYYGTLLLNEATAEINDKNVTFSTIDKCIQVLETGTENQMFMSEDIAADAISRLDTCHERLFASSEEDEYCTYFYDADADNDICQYTAYEELVRRMLNLYLNGYNSYENFEEVLEKYALTGTMPAKLSIPHLDSYITLLSDINSGITECNKGTESGQITKALACLNSAKETLEYFAQAFTEFEAENFAYAKELIIDEKYQQLRDDFIEEKSVYWEGSFYIPVNREQMVFYNKDGQYRFRFLDYDECENSKGVIYVWGTKQEDDGVLRSAISYVPAKDKENDTHTEYIVQYLYSNVTINGKYVPQMNYRFDTKVTTPEGTTTTAIGDWGGEHEFEIDY